MLRFRQWGKELKASGPECETNFFERLQTKQLTGGWTAGGLAAERKALLGACAKPRPQAPTSWMLSLEILWSGSPERYGGARKFSRGVRKLCSNWRTLLKALARASAGISNNSRLKVTSGIRV